VITLVRLTPDGGFDTTFGVDGILHACFADYNCWLSEIALQPDSKIVAVGGIERTDPTTGSITRVGLVRVDQDGVVDASFGSGGFVMDEPAPQSYAAGVALDDEGRIVVTTFGADGISVQDKIRLATLRYLANGERDDSFGVSGVAAAPFAQRECLPGHNVVIDPDGASVGICTLIPFEPSGPRPAIGVVRHASDGSRDPTFGDDGLLVFDEATGASSVAADAAGRTIIVGRDRSSPMMARLLPNGALDETFGVDGIVAMAEHGISRAVEVADGKIVAIGSTEHAFHHTSVTMARFEASGVLDLGFGVQGVSLVSTGSACSTGYAHAVQPDGRIVVVGGHGDCISKSDFLIARICP
jgi:uncharacterized delta-60 repeat protein